MRSGDNGRPGNRAAAAREKKNDNVEASRRVNVEGKGARKTEREKTRKKQENQMREYRKYAEVRKPVCVCLCEVFVCLCVCVRCENAGATSRSVTRAPCEVSAAGY